MPRRIVPIFDLDDTLIHVDHVHAHNPHPSYDFLYGSEFPVKLLHKEQMRLLMGWALEHCDSICVITHGNYDRSILDDILKGYGINPLLSFKILYANQPIINSPTHKAAYRLFSSADIPPIAHKVISDDGPIIEYPDRRKTTTAKVLYTEAGKSPEDVRFVLLDDDYAMCELAIEASHHGIKAGLPRGYLTNPLFSRSEKTKAAILFEHFFATRYFVEMAKVIGLHDYATQAKSEENPEKKRLASEYLASETYKMHEQYPQRIKAVLNNPIFIALEVAIAKLHAARLKTEALLSQSRIKYPDIEKIADDAHEFCVQNAENHLTYGAICLFIGQFSDEQAIYCQRLIEKINDHTAVLNEKQKILKNPLSTRMRLSIHHGRKREREEEDGKTSRSRTTAKYPSFHVSSDLRIEARAPTCSSDEKKEVATSADVLCRIAAS